MTKRITVIISIALVVLFLLGSATALSGSIQRLKGAIGEESDSKAFKELMSGYTVGGSMTFDTPDVFKHESSNPDIWTNGPWRIIDRSSHTFDLVSGALALSCQNGSETFVVDTGSPAEYGTDLIFSFSVKMDHTSDAIYSRFSIKAMDTSTGKERSIPLFVIQNDGGVWLCDVESNCETYLTRLSRYYYKTFMCQVSLETGTMNVYVDGDLICDNLEIPGYVDVHGSGLK